MGSRRTGLRALAVIAALAMTVTACGRGTSGESSGSGATASAPGITDTEITIGSTAPLSGPVGANGTAAMGAVKAYFDMVNANGGVKMSDGKTRKLKFVYYDDGYQPQKSVQNYRQLTGQDHVFALLQSFGTAPNLAIMPLANADKVPQVFVHAGDLVFSEDQQKNPWTIGWQSTYEDEGKAQGKRLAAEGKPLTVAVLRQGDTLGQVFLQGFKEGIEGSQVKIVGEQTYTPADPTVESQISTLKATNADVLFLAVAVVPLMINGIKHALTLGWSPEMILVSMSSSVSQVIQGGGINYDKLYTAQFVKTPDNPATANDPAVQKMVSAMKQYAPNANPAITNAQWGWGAAETFVEALKNMKTVSRQGLMDSIHSLKDGKDVDILLPGITLDGTDKHYPPVHGIKIEHYENGAWNIVK